MNTRRKQFFFWLGVFVLPLFWSWFTLDKSFSRRERLAAFLWLGGFVVWLLSQGSNVVDGWQKVAVTYPAILGWVAVALGVWLFSRTVGFPATFIEIFVLIDVVAVIHPSSWFEDRIGQPFDWLWLAVPLIIALAHLAVEPLKGVSAEDDFKQVT